MNIGNLAIRLLFSLTIPLGLIAQSNESSVDQIFDKEYFKDLNIEMLELFASNEDVNPLMTSFIFVLDNYGIPGMSDKAKNESLVIKEITERKNAQLAELQEYVILKPGKELLDYFLEYLDPETIISYRVVAKGKVLIRRYLLIYEIH